jgi:hypothetical protein
MALETVLAENRLDIPAEVDSGGLRRLAGGNGVAKNSKGKERVEPGGLHRPEV